MQASLPAPGDAVWIRQRRWRVRRAVRFDNVVRLDVSARHEHQTFLTPFDHAPTAQRRERRLHVRPRHARARLCRLVADAHTVRTLLAAVSANVDLLPHQLEPALAMIAGESRRVLIADEVGLGKTIQAGLIVAELLRRLPDPRVLIVVPSTLVDQWRDELQTRFRVTSQMAGREALEQLVRANRRGENPWARSGVWLASLDYIKQPHVLAALPRRAWDLVVFDEAHGVAGDTDRHAVAATLATRARRLLLLTATPHDGDDARFERLSRLGELGDRLTVFRRTRAELAFATVRRIRWQYLSPRPEERRLLNALMDFEAAALKAAGSSRRQMALLLLSVVRKRALSTMRALAISLERRLSWIERNDQATTEWQPSLFFGTNDTAADDMDADECGALAGDIGLDRRRERAWLKRLLALAEASRRQEHKLDHVLALLRRTRECVVIFTEFRHSLDAIHARLAAIRSVAVLHGGQSPLERSRELERFQRGDASVLLATDVAGLGLNLQHRARWVISLELPWNPTRLEQRLGRVDRIGQTRPVHFTVLLTRHAAETAVVSRVTERAITARAALGEDVLQAMVIDPLHQRLNVALDQIALCRTWSRPARVAARQLHRRRALASRWRSDDVDAGRVRVAALPQIAVTCVFSVPIVDGHGSAIEEHVVAVRSSITADHRFHPSVIDPMRDAARRSLRGHLARVHRWQKRQHAADGARGRAIVAGLVRDLEQREPQPGLFDRRALNRLDASHAALADLQTDHVACLDDPDAVSAQVGHPHLALLLRSR